MSEVNNENFFGHIHSNGEGMKQFSYIEKVRWVSRCRKNGIERVLPLVIFANYVRYSNEYNLYGLKKLKLETGYFGNRNGSRKKNKSINELTDADREVYQ